MGTDFLPNINLSQLEFQQNSNKIPISKDPFFQEPQSPAQNRGTGDPLDFLIRSNSEANLDPLVPPDQVPQQTLQLKALPNEILKSSTVENLISQNDDLMARLKVSLRRLALIENENLKLKEEFQKFSQRHENMTDQILIGQERDRIWKLKIDHFEKQKEVAEEKAGKLTLHNRNLRAELDRYHKYHDRIKNQVKPYIAQLKDFAKVLQEKNQKLEKDLSKYEIQTEQLRHQILEISDNAKEQISIQDRKVEDMVRYYEAHVESQSVELDQRRRENEDLHERAKQAHKFAEKVNTLENELLQTQRLKEELKNRLESENIRLKGKVQELSRNTTTQELELKDLKQRVLEDEKLQKEQERKLEDLNQQMESLRYMWNAKNEENEKLKTALDSLEKLNLSLSSKLNDWRQEPPSC